MLADAASYGLPYPHVRIRAETIALAGVKSLYCSRQAMCALYDEIFYIYPPAIEFPGYFAEQVLQMEELAATRYDNIRDEGGRSMGEAPPNDDIF